MDSRVLLPHGGLGLATNAPHSTRFTVVVVFPSLHPPSFFLMPFRESSLLSLAL